MQVTTITNLVGGKSLEFQEFKALSKRFREGSVSCAEYYDKCLGVVGEGAFFAFLPELLALLPDIKKQIVEIAKILHSIPLIKRPDSKRYCLRSGRI